MFESWRGIVGDIKPTHRPGSLEEFIRLLPEGIGVIPLTVGISSGTEQEFRDVLTDYKQKAAELAGLGVDMIHIGGAPPMMVHGFSGEEKIVRALEVKHGVPVSTSGRCQAAGMRALSIKSFVGVTYFKESLNQIFSRYFTEAGFEVAAMEGIDVPFKDVGRLSAEEIYSHTKKAFLKHPDAQAIYMLGSGWRLLKIVSLLEQDLQVPVIYALSAKLWDVQKRLRVRQPVKGYGRLLEELP
ncbi:MAG: maleate cis-trans isomerase family protein [Candidatus Binatia bacterium]